MEQIKRWEAEEAYFGDLSSAYISRPTKIHGLKPGDEALGFTSVSEKGVANISIARLHEIMKSMTEKEQSFFRLGIFAHEALHQVFTNFDETVRILKSLPTNKMMLFKEVSNVVEDTRIEYFASQVFGGDTLSALQFTIKQIYYNSPELGAETQPAIQTLNALIQLGDVGIIRGKFTFPEAFECFQKVVPYFEEAVKMPVCADALRYSLKITDIISELLPPPSKEDYSESNKHSEYSNGSGAGSDAKERTDAEGKPMPSKIPKEVLDALGAGPAPKPDELPENPPSSAEDDFFDDEDDLLDIEDFPDSETPASSELSGTGEGSPTETADEELEEINKRIQELFENSEESAEDDFSKEIDSVSDAIDSAADSLEKEEEKNSSDAETKIENVKLKNDRFTSLIVNKKMPPAPVKYAAIVEQNAELITATKNALKRYFMNMEEEKVRHTNGDLNLRRYFDETYSSARVFDKRKESDNKNACMMILADESGSTCGKKERAIKASAAILAEVCASLNIPCYVLGFSADEIYNEADIRHYTTWENKREDRTSIANMKGRDNNRDGTSIRYAVSLLKNRKEEHKILFVISDGAPLAQNYYDRPAIDDTKQAIREAKKVCDLKGILVGTSSVETVHEMYENDFLLVDNAAELPAQLSKLFRKMF